MARPGGRILDYRTAGRGRPDRTVWGLMAMAALVLIFPFFLLTGIPSVGFVVLTLPMLERAACVLALPSLAFAFGAIGIVQNVMRRQREGCPASKIIGDFVFFRMDLAAMTGFWGGAICICCFAFVLNASPA